MRGWQAVFSVLIGGVIALAGAPCWAQARDEHARVEHGRDEHPHVDAHAQIHHDAPAYRGEISRFHEHDWAVWHGGHWEHSIHGGRHGWWWVAGGLWYFYPSPIYPIPNPYEPPPTIIDAPPPNDELPPPPMPSNWYYCNSAQAYYPYVESCPEGWRAVPATPAPAAAPGAPGAPQ
jgi:hypothetical protein